MCIDIMGIWLGLLTGKFCEFLTEFSVHATPVFSFQDNNLSQSQCIFTQLDVCIETVEIWFGIGYEQILSCPRHICILVSRQ